MQRDRLTRPTAVVCDVGDTLLREVRFDLEAGIRAALPSRMRDAAASLAHAFREELASLRKIKTRILGKKQGWAHPLSLLGYS